MSVRVAVVEDHPIVRVGLRALLSSDRDLRVIGEAAGEQDGLQLVRAERPDVLLLDLRLRNGDGLSVLRALRAEGIRTSVLVYTSYSDAQHVRSALAAGATGYVLKDSDSREILSAIHAVSAGRRYVAPEAALSLENSCQPESLTPREEQVLVLLARGHTNGQIAGILGISAQTVKGHLKQILPKLGATTRTEAASAAIRQGLVAAD